MVAFYIHTAEFCAFSPTPVRVCLLRWTLSSSTPLGALYVVILYKKKRRFFHALKSLDVCWNLEAGPTREGESRKSLQREVLQSVWRSKLTWIVRVPIYKSKVPCSCEVHFASLFFGPKKISWSQFFKSGRGWDEEAAVSNEESNQQNTIIIGVGWAGSLPWQLARFLLNQWHVSSDPDWPQKVAKISVRLWTDRILNEPPPPPNRRQNSSIGKKPSELLLWWKRSTRRRWFVSQDGNNFSVLWRKCVEQFLRDICSDITNDQLGISGETGHGGSNLYIYWMNSAATYTEVVQFHSWCVTPHSSPTRGGWPQPINYILNIFILNYYIH